MVLLKSKMLLSHCGLFQVELQFDPKKGFTLFNPMLIDSGDYTCRAVRGEQIQDINIAVEIFRKCYI